MNFDSPAIAFDEMLNVFFAIHDLTTLDRQSGDVGRQYRPAIFYHSPEQATAEKKIRSLAVEFASSIVTHITSASQFFMAEDYHSEYFRLNRHPPGCQFVISPKVCKFRKLFPAKPKAS